METSETPVLIEKFRSAHSAGMRALNDFSKKGKLGETRDSHEWRFLKEINKIGLPSR